jgi:hypothetical protein
MSSEAVRELDPRARRRRDPPAAVAELALRPGLDVWFVVKAKEAPARVSSSSDRSAAVRAAGRPVEHRSQSSWSSTRYHWTREGSRSAIRFRRSSLITTDHPRLA